MNNLYTLTQNDIVEAKVYNRADDLALQVYYTNGNRPTRIRLKWIGFLFDVFKFFALIGTKRGRYE